MTDSLATSSLGAKTPAKETLLTPRFYTTDFNEMAALDVSSNLDRVEFNPFSIDSSKANSPKADDLYINFFNRERFWKPDTDYLQGVVNNSVSASNNLSAPLFSVASIGTKDLSFIVRKAVGLSGYGVMAKDLRIPRMSVNQI